MAVRADLAVDLEAALERRAVIGAKRRRTTSSRWAAAGSLLRQGGVASARTRRVRRACASVLPLARPPPGMSLVLGQHRGRDARRQRQRPLEPADQREQDVEMEE